MGSESCRRRRCGARAGLSELAIVARGGRRGAIRHNPRSAFFRTAPMTVRVLTGITTTGTPHLGNYVGAIRPAIAASRRSDVESFLFMADYHALVKCDDP